MLMFRWRGN